MRHLANSMVFIVFLTCLIFSFNLEGSESYSNNAVRIMSFNIRYNNAGDGKNAWPYRKHMVAQTIIFHKAEIIGIQEALYSQIQDLQILLPDFYWKGVGRDDGRKKGEFAPVFYKKDRYQVIKNGNFWLSEQPDEAGSIGWDAACPRIVTWIEFKDKNSGLIFYFFNTHFDHVGSEARKNSAELLRKRINEIDSKTSLILTGDFNCTCQEASYKVLTTESDSKGVLQNSMDISLNGHYGGTQTFNGFTDVQRPGYIIDFIFVKSVDQILHHGIIAEKWDGGYASDHYPVYTEIMLKNKKSVIQ